MFPTQPDTSWTHRCGVRMKRRADGCQDKAQGGRTQGPHLASAPPSKTNRLTRQPRRPDRGDAICHVSCPDAPQRVLGMVTREDAAQDAVIFYRGHACVLGELLVELLDGPVARGGLGTDRCLHFVVRPPDRGDLGGESEDI